MDDENRKEENEGASTSKKKETKERTTEGEYEECVRDDATYSNNSSMTDFSTRSRAMKAAKKRAVPAQAAGKRAARRKYPPRVRRGRVMKRRRPYQPPKRKPRVEKPQPAESVSTHFTTSKTGSVNRSRSCKLCGHRCCGRRYGKNKISRVAKNQEGKQGLNRKPKNQYKKKRNQEMCRKLLRQSNEDKVTHKSGVVSTRAAGNQIGSNAKVLSPLLIATTDKALTADDPTADDPTSDPDSCIIYTEITPEIIYEVLERLTRWRQVVPMETILKMIKAWYPVNPNPEELFIELNEKIVIATIAGITMEVVKNGVRLYCLTCELMQKGLEQNHVSMFWQLYADTMSPVKRRLIIPPPEKPSPTSDDKETKEYRKKTHR